MTDVSEVPIAPPAPLAGNGYDAAIMAKTRELIEKTTRSQRSIAEELLIPPTTVSKWKRTLGWVRPADAPKQPLFLTTAGRRHRVAPIGRTDRRVERLIGRKERRAERLIGRLYRVCAEQVGLIETQLANSEEALEEKDARALATLAKTLATLMALERDDGAKRTDPEAVDPDEIRAKLARRLYALGQSGE